MNYSLTALFIPILLLFSSTVQAQFITGDNITLSGSDVAGSGNNYWGQSRIGSGTVVLSGYGMIYRNSSNVEHFKVDGGHGNVAIGNTPAYYKLTVNGGVGETGISIWTDGRIISSSTAGGVQVGNDRFVGGTGGVDKKIGFWASKWYLTVNTNGGVAIGENAHTMNVPLDCKLAVAGKIMAREIKVTVTGLGDYVFSPAYRLRPLSEVSDFIKLKGHLPEVPSAAQVAKEGLNVGEMENTLLKKVEELTLYLLEHEQRLKTLQQENEALKKMLKKQ